MWRQHLMTIWLFKRRRVPCMKGHEPAVTHAGMAYITHTYKKAPLLQEVTSAEWNAWRQRAEAGQDRTLEIKEREFNRMTGGGGVSWLMLSSSADAALELQRRRKQRMRKQVFFIIILPLFATW